MTSINRVLLVGRLTRDPELRHTQGGTAVCQLSLAVNSREKNSSGEWDDRADFFDVTVWGSEGEACAQYLVKGRQVGIDGRLRQDRWEKDGQKHSKVKITATAVQFLDRADGAAESGGDAPGDALPFDPRNSESAPDDDIPF